MLLRMVYPQWPPPPPPGNAQERFQRKVCDGYAQWLVDVQGLSAATLCKNGDAARVFLQWLNENAAMGSLRRLSVKDIDAYLPGDFPICGEPREWVFVVASGAFFGIFTRQSESVATWLPRFQVLPCISLRTSLVHSPNRRSRQCLSARRDRSPAGLRDYAMLLMLATYGLRSGEVLRLRLEDIQWREERFRVRQSKTGVESFLPLMSPIGEALVAYLKEGRPQTEHREVFLRVRAPFGPLAGPASFATVIFRRLRESGIEVKGRMAPMRFGSHAR